MPDVTGTIHVGSAPDGGPLASCKVELMAFTGREPAQSRPVGATGSPRVVPVGTRRLGSEARTGADGGFNLPTTGIRTDERLFLRFTLEDDRGVVKVCQWGELAVAANGPAWEIRHPAAGGQFLPDPLPAGPIDIDVPDTAAGRPSSGGQVGTMRQAALIYRSMMRGNAWFAQNVGTPRLEKVFPIFPFDAPIAAYAFHAAGERARIVVPTYCADSASVLLHEFGHHVFYTGVPWYHSAGGPHAGYDPQGATGYATGHGFTAPYTPAQLEEMFRFQLMLDFSEGYAHFFGNNARGSATYTRHQATGGPDFSADFENALGAAQLQSLSRNPHHLCFGFGDVPTAGYLWDLTDAPNPAEPDDTIQLPFREVHQHMIQWAGRHQAERPPALTLPSFHRHLVAVYPHLAAALEANARRNGLAQLMQAQAGAVGADALAAAAAAR